MICTFFFPLLRNHSFYNFTGMVLIKWFLYLVTAAYAPYIIRIKIHTNWKILYKGFDWICKYDSIFSYKRISLQCLMTCAYGLLSIDHQLTPYVRVDWNKMQLLDLPLRIGSMRRPYPSASPGFILFFFWFSTTVKQGGATSRKSTCFMAASP